TGHHAKHDSQSKRAIAQSRRIRSKGFKGRGNGVMSDGAGPAEPRMAGESRPGRSGRDRTYAQRTRRTWSGKLFRGQRFTAGEGLSKNGHSPSRRRYCAFTAHKNSTHVHLRKMSVALAPPKPKELERAYSSLASVGSFGMGNAHTGSGVSSVEMGGNHCSRKAFRQIRASTAP